MDEIQGLFHAYITNHNELTNIRQDVQNYQKQYKNRIQELQKKNKEYEKTLLKFMEDKNLPGIRNGNVVLMAHEKASRRNNQEMKQEKLKTIFNTYQVDPTSRMYNDLLEVVQAKNLGGKTEKTIKIKKCEENKDP